jgi:hypothetical protein
VHEEVHAVVDLRLVELVLDLGGEGLLHARRIHVVDPVVRRDARNSFPRIDHAHDVEHMRRCARGERDRPVQR